MLVHGVPWQAALLRGFVAGIALAICLIGALVLGAFGWLPLVGGTLLISSFALLLGLFPLFMNLSRSYFTFLLVLLVVQIGTTLVAYALHYHHSGLIDADGRIVVSYTDSLYFSVITFTTVGYGDLRPAEGFRLVAAMEAITGVISMALGTSFLWLWCTENMIPKELALFDGNRRRKGGLAIHRMRIRTLTGKSADGPEWVKPKPGSFRHNLTTGEWEEIVEPEKLKPGDTILESDK